MLDIIIAAISVAAFFIHMTLNTLPPEVEKSKNEYFILNKENIRTLNNLKEFNFDLAEGKFLINDFYLQKQRLLVEEYQKANKAKHEKAKSHNKLIASYKIYGFDNLQFFLGEIWCLGLLLYSFKNFKKEFKINKLMNKWELLRHAIYIYIGGFFSCYLFLDGFPAEKADYPVIFYYYSMAFCLLFVLPSVYFFNKYLITKNETTLIRHLLHLVNHPYREMSSIALDNKAGINEEIILEKVDKVEKDTIKVLDGIRG